MTVPGFVLFLRVPPNDGTRAVATVARRALKHEHTLIDESHFSISILRCPECSQRFVSIFTELIDWEDGDDSQYSQPACQASRRNAATWTAW